MAISAFYGLQGGMLQMEGIPIYPKGKDLWGNDILAAHATHFKADIVITLMDVWVLSFNATSKVRWCPWVPIDHKPAPPPVERRLHEAWQPIVFSRFAFDELKGVGIKPKYVPHGIDTDRFRPMSKGNARKKVGLPQDAFVMGMVAANKGVPARKSFPQVVEAYKRFLNEVTDEDIKLFIHTEPRGRDNGVNLYEMLSRMDIPDGTVLFSDEYQYALGYPPDYLVNLYNAMDLFLNPSYGEGFGLPIVEAQACGTPSVVTDWTAMSELCFAGWKVGGIDWYTPQAAWWMIPSVDEIFEAMKACYEMSEDDYGRLCHDARVGALQYDVNKVVKKYWKPVLEDIEAEIAQGGSLEMVEFGQ